MVGRHVGVATTAVVRVDNLVVAVAVALADVEGDGVPEVETFSKAVGIRSTGGSTDPEMVWMSESFPEG